MKTFLHSKLAVCAGAGILAATICSLFEIKVEYSLFISGIFAYVAGDETLSRVLMAKISNPIPPLLQLAFRDEVPNLPDINEDPLAIQINEAAKQREKEELERQRLEMEAEAQKFIDEVETQIMLAHLNMVKAPGLVQKVPEYFTMKSLQGLNIVPTKRLIVLAMMRDQVIANNNFLQRSQDDNLESPL